MRKPRVRIGDLRDQIQKQKDHADHWRQQYETLQRQYALYREHVKAPEGLIAKDVAEWLRERGYTVNDPHVVPDHLSAALDELHGPLQ